jgi:Icc-related predicted phosphoesterase
VTATKNTEFLEQETAEVAEKMCIIRACLVNFQSGYILCELCDLLFEMTAVLGNHDFESGKADEVQAIIEKVGVTFLDGSCLEINEVGFAGVCGFGGGFDRRMLSAWGEPLIKAFVQESVDHSLRLGKALTNLNTEKKVVVLHYSPIRTTVTGEHPEVFPFLGSSHLEATIDNFGASVVFHGHSHHGQLEGRTTRDVPVFNVALPVLLRTTEKPFFLYKL